MGRRGGGRVGIVRGDERGGTREGKEERGDAKTEVVVIQSES